MKVEPIGTFQLNSVNSVFVSSSVNARVSEILPIAIQTYYHPINFVFSGILPDFTFLLLCTSFGCVIYSMIDYLISKIKKTEKAKFNTNILKIFFTSFIIIILNYEIYSNYIKYVDETKEHYSIPLPNILIPLSISLIVSIIGIIGIFKKNKKSVENSDKKNRKLNFILVTIVGVYMSIMLSLILFFRQG